MRVFNIFYITVLLVLSSLPLYAKPKFGDTGAEFVRFRRFIQDNGWGDDAAKIFQQDRSKIPKDDEAVILVLIGSDPEAHYWIASFLSTHNQYNEKDLKFAELILLQADCICANSPGDQELRAQWVTINVIGSVIAQRLDFSVIASKLKRQAEEMMAHEKILSTAFPALTDDDRKIYLKIKQ